MAKQGGYGVVVKITVASTLTAIAAIKKFKFPENEKKMADATTHDSDGGWAEWLATGRFEQKEASITLVWDKSLPTHAALVTAFNSTSPVSVSFQDHAGTEITTINAHITKMSRTSEQDGLYECEVGILPTGKPVVTP